MDSQILWNTWAWIHLESGQKRAALSRLCSSVDRKLDTSAPSPALLLKTKSHLSSTRDYTLSSRKLDISASYAKSLVLLEYLSAEGSSGTTSHAQGNITAALASVGRFEEELISLQLGSSLLHEEFLQSAARLLYYHATHGQVNFAPFPSPPVFSHHSHAEKLTPNQAPSTILHPHSPRALRQRLPSQHHIPRTLFLGRICPPHRRPHPNSPGANCFRLTTRLPQHPTLCYPSRGLRWHSTLDACRVRSRPGQRCVPRQHRHVGAVYTILL